MLRTIPYLCLILSSLPVAAVAAENWSQFLGPDASGHAGAAKLPLRWSESENVTWKTPIRGRAWSSPVVWGRQIWLTTAPDDGKQLYAVCVDRDSGKIVHDLKIFDVEKPRFRHKLNTYASPTPVIEEGRVYVHFGSYGTACLDTASGKTLWSRRDLPCDHFRGPGSSPILYKNLLIVHFDGADVQYVVALDKSDGRTVWKTPRSNDFGGSENGDFKKAYSTPIVIDAAGKTQLISAGSRAAMAYDPLTGKEIWQVTFSSFSSTARPLYGHGLVYINTGFSKADLIAVRPDGEGDVTETHVVWTVRRNVASKPSQLLIGDLIFMIHDAGIASCLEAKTSKRLWTERIGGNFSSSPVTAGDRIYLFSHEGKTTVLRAARKFEKLAENELENGFMASPAVSGDSLFLRSKTHLYRLDDGATKSAQKSRE